MQQATLKVISTLQIQSAMPTSRVVSLHNSNLLVFMARMLSCMLEVKMYSYEFPNLLNSAHLRVEQPPSLWLFTPAFCCLFLSLSHTHTPVRVLTLFSLCHWQRWPQVRGKSNGSPGDKRMQQNTHTEVNAIYPLHFWCLDIQVIHAHEYWL